MKTALAICLALAATPVMAKYDTIDVARALGTVIASETFCGLRYDQAAIQAFIEKRVLAADTDFLSTLTTMTWTAGLLNEKMSESAKIARCTQVARVAKNFGFIQEK